MMSKSKKQLVKTSYKALYYRECVNYYVILIEVPLTMVLPCSAHIRTMIMPISHVNFHIKGSCDHYIRQITTVTTVNPFDYLRYYVIDTTRNMLNDSYTYSLCIIIIFNILSLLLVTKKFPVLFQQAKYIIASFLKSIYKCESVRI